MTGTGSPHSLPSPRGFVGRGTSGSSLKAQDLFSAIVRNKKPFCQRDGRVHLLGTLSARAD